MKTDTSERSLERLICTRTNRLTPVIQAETGPRLSRNTQSYEV